MANQFDDGVVFPKNCCIYYKLQSICSQRWNMVYHENVEKTLMEEVNVFLWIFISIKNM